MFRLACAAILSLAALVQGATVDADQVSYGVSGRGLLEANGDKPVGPRRCGTLGRRCCRGHVCRGDLICNRAGRCQAPRCGGEGQPCCPVVHHGVDARCGPKLACFEAQTSGSTESECQMCGLEDQIACNPTDQDTTSPHPLFCHEPDLEPVFDADANESFCKRPEPSCPGKLGEPCCRIISDSGPCECGARCDTEPFFGVRGADSPGVCVSCGGPDELACFELTIQGPTGPFCQPGLFDTADDPPICTPDGGGAGCMGPNCSSNCLVPHSTE